MSKIPMDVITDIFYRLQVKTLVRFKSLSKPCCALIDGPDFINHHLQRSIKTNSNRNLILKNLHLYSVSLDSLDCATVLNYPVNLAGGTEAFGSSNGLIALRSSDKDLALYNPSTRKQFKLPVEPVESTGDSCSPGYVFYGFGYDSVSDDYKVVRMVTFNRTDGVGNDDDDYDGDEAYINCFQYEVKVYSVRNNSWRRVNNLPKYLRFMFQFFYHLLHRRGYGVLVNGVLHWLMPRRPELGMGRDLIVGFDLGAEVFCELSQPDYDGYDFQIDVGVLDGCLCVVCNYSQSYVDVWMMKEYGVKKSWSKVYRVQRPKTLKNFSFLRPLAYSKDDSDKVLMELNNEKLVWYDVVRKRFRTVRINGAPNSFCAEVYVESLVPLKGGDDEICKKQEQKEEEKKQQNRKKRDDFLSVGFKLVL